MVERGRGNVQQGSMLHLLAAAAVFSGCAAAPGFVPDPVELAASPPTLLHSPLVQQGNVGETLCVDAEVTGACPVLGNSHRARIELLCDTGVPQQIDANLSWEASGPLPFRMSVSFWYGTAEDPQTDSDTWSSTDSPLPFHHDLRPYANESSIWLGIDGWGDGRAPDTNLGVRASTRTPFELTGTITCEHSP